MEQTLGIVVFAVVAVAAVVSLLLLPGRRKAYEEIGRSVLLESEPAADDAAHSLEAEVRQLVEARNARRVRNGEPPLDVATEVARQLRELRGG